VIKGMLFNVWVVCAMLVIGGVILIIVDRIDFRPVHHDATAFTLPMYAGIGIFQCLAMIPGVSRSGATIVSAMFLGADKRSAAEFSFYLAMPTMVGAFSYDLLKNYKLMTASNTMLVVIGFLCSFVVGWIVVKSLLNYVSRHGFSLFGWWRIAVGSLGLIALFLGK
jgi:undecaprenyl-diphosphatase